MIMGNVTIMLMIIIIIILTILIIMVIMIIEILPFNLSKVHAIDVRDFFASRDA